MLKMILQKVNHMEGIEIAGYGEEFDVKLHILTSSKYDENDRSTYNIFHVRVNDCKVSRQCDFDINRIDYGLENKKASMDSNNNFISDYYYQTVELEITKDVDDNETSGVYDNIFQTVWYIESLKDDGTHPPIKNAGTVGSDAEANQMGKHISVLKKVKQKINIILYIYRRRG